jgi:hypothetical protein
MVQNPDFKADPTYICEQNILSDSESILVELYRRILGAF